MILIPGGIEISPETNWLPNWSPSVFLYAVVTMTILTTIPFYYSSLKLYCSFREQELRKKWSYFIIGTSMLYFILYGTFISHLIFNQMFYLVFSPIKLIFAISGTILSYYGVIKQF